MRLLDLARDTALVPRSLRRIERRMRGGFINIRVRQIRAAMPDPTDIPDADVPGLIEQLKDEIRQTEAAYNEIRSRVDADIAAGKFLDLSQKDRKRVSRRSRYRALGSTRRIRQRLVQSAVWWACATHNSLQDPADIEDLHLLVDRRVRIVERMLYDVGAGGGRKWDAKAIFNNPSGHWEDGWTRMFEYPRVLKKVGSSGMRRRIFRERCNPSSTGDHVCETAGMDQWHEHSFRYIKLRDTTWPGRTKPMRIRLNSSARPFWEPDPVYLNNDYRFQLKSGRDPVQAIEKLFERVTGYEDYKDRNLLFCDHVIHALHMESLLWAKKKRSANTSWLTSYVSSPDKLRIYAPFWPDGPPYLGGQNDGVYFEHKRIHSGTAQIGDHLLVYNHPAYDKATVGGVWRLENAIVVQVYPHLLYQGHGTNPLTIGDMKAKMIGLFNRGLQRLRVILLVEFAQASGWPSLNIPNFGTKSGETQWRGFADSILTDILRRGHTEEIRIKRQRAIGALRFAFRRLVGGLPAAFQEIDFGGNGKLVRRFDFAASTYLPILRYADWWLRWLHDDKKGESAIAANQARRDLAKQIHKIEYDATHAYFPLWEPQLRRNGRNRSPYRNSSGKISRIQQVRVSADMVTAWTWYMPDSPALRSETPVIRPRV